MSDSHLANCKRQAAERIDEIDESLADCEEWQTRKIETLEVRRDDFESGLAAVEREIAARDESDLDEIEERELR